MLNEKNCYNWVEFIRMILPPSEVKNQIKKFTYNRLHHARSGKDLNKYYWDNYCK